MYKKMIPLFFVPLLATTALASEQTGLPEDVHRVINQHMMGAPSDGQDASNKALLMKETLAKTDKVFKSFDGFDEYMTQVAQWGVKLRSITVNVEPHDEASLLAMLDMVAYHANTTNAIIIKTSAKSELWFSTVTDCFLKNPSLTSVTIITPTYDQKMVDLLSRRYPNRAIVKKAM